MKRYTRQVEDAKIALRENGGGLIAYKEPAITTHILEGPQRHNPRNRK